MFEQPERIKQNFELIKQGLSRLVIAKDNATITKAMRDRVLSSHENSRITLIGESDKSLSSDIVSTINLLMTGGLSFVEAMNIALIGKYPALANQVVDAGAVDSPESLAEYNSSDNIKALTDWAVGVYTDAQAVAVRMDNNSPLYDNYFALTQEGALDSTFAYGNDFRAFDSIADSFRSGDRLVWYTSDNRDSYRFAHAELFENLVKAMLALTTDQEIKREILATLKSGAITDNYLHEVGKLNPMQRRSMSVSGKTMADIESRVFPGCAIPASQEEVLKQMLEITTLTVDWFVEKDVEKLQQLAALHSLQVSLVTQAMIELLVQIGSQVNINNLDASKGAYTLHETGKDIVLAAAEPLLIESLVEFAESLDVKLENPFPQDDKNSYAPIYVLQRKMILDLVRRALSGETIDFPAAFITEDLSNTDELEAYLWSTKVMYDLYEHLLSRRGKKFHVAKNYSALSQKAIEVSRKLLPQLSEARSNREINEIIRNEISALKLDDLLPDTES